MVFNPDGKEPFLIRSPTRLEKVERSLHNAIDVVLAMHALNIVKGQYTHEELSKMIGIVAEARPKFGKEFTIEEGLKAIMAAFRIEISREKPAEDKGG